MKLPYFFKTSGTNYPLMHHHITEEHRPQLGPSLFMRRCRQAHPTNFSMSVISRHWIGQNVGYSKGQLFLMGPAGQVHLYMLGNHQTHIHILLLILLILFLLLLLFLFLLLLFLFLILLVLLLFSREIKRECLVMTLWQNGCPFCLPERRDRRYSPECAFCSLDSNQCLQKNALSKGFMFEVQGFHMCSRRFVSSEIWRCVPGLVVLDVLMDLSIIPIIYLRGRTIKFANSPPCACRGSTGQKL